MVVSGQNSNMGHFSHPTAKAMGQIVMWFTPLNDELERTPVKAIIDELLSQYGKEPENNTETIKRVHSRVDQIQTSYKAVKAVGMFIVASLTAVGAWFGISNK